MIHLFIGTKAQLIKMAPIMRELQRRNIEYNFIFSGQHQETIKDLRQNFNVKDPDIILYKGNDITGIFQMLVWLTQIFFKVLFKKNVVWKKDKKGIVLNHGDTFSTLAGTLLARMHGHKAAHIESGLRSFNFFHPFPEELTRVIVFHLSTHYFCPNEWAYKNLQKYSGEKIITGGNTLYDALQIIKKMPLNQELAIPNEDYAIVSLHRFENVFNRSSLERLISMISKISEEIKLIFIAHNPTIKKLKEYELFSLIADNVNIELRPRYDYSNFIALVMKSKFVVTDGGSNQEECFYLGKPCLILRNATERTEGLAENAVLSKFNEEMIMEFVSNYENHERSEKLISPSPTELIVNYLSNHFLMQLPKQLKAIE